MIQRFGESFTQSAVLVDNAALAHTTQLIAEDQQASSAESEIKDVLRQLSAVLTDFDSSTNDIIKLNLYVADDKVATTAEKFLSPATRLQSTQLMPRQPSQR